MIPENITKAHILQGIKDIDSEGIKSLHTMSKIYDLIYEDKVYPPKLVISLANKYANGEVLHYSKFNTNEAQKRLRETSAEFIIKTKDNDPIANIISRYKDYIKANSLQEEIYKWELLKKYKNRPDTKAADFYTEVKQVNFSNLIYPVGLLVVYHIARDMTEPYRECFKRLFNEKAPLAERVKYFNEETLAIYRKLVPDERFSHHQDERTIATFLTYHNPSEYTLYKHSFYQKYCKLINVKPKSKGQKYVHYLELVNEFVLEYIKDDGELIGLIKANLNENCFEDENFKILAQDILYQTLDKQIGMGRSYWRIGTSDGTNSYWELMEQNNRICIGWNELGDLNDYEIKSKKDIDNYLKAEGFYLDDNRLRSRKAGEIFNFYNEIKIGDVILAQDGAAVLGIGIINDEYQFNASDGFAHQKGVEWKLLGSPLNNSEGLRTTVYKLSDINLINKVNTLIDNAGLKITVENSQIMAPPLNQILFGPPGTGKTYNTVNKAIAITNPEFNLNQPRENIKQEFDRLMKNGQIIFTTFHQSMSYEDFIEGIKPVEPKKEEHAVTYKVIDGIFKKACNPNSNIFYLGQKVGSYEVVNISPELITMRKPNGSLISFQFSMLLKLLEYLKSKNIHLDNFSGKIDSEDIDKKAFPELESYIVNGYSNIIPGLLKIISHNKSELDGNNIVLIIDEINRGNVSQIFGELITLVEEDKRLGKDEALEVILPYSKQKFGVPPNLYIIGTMNTADRSVEALDTALRRRFYFTEMAPNASLIAKEGRLRHQNGLLEGVSLPELLETINKRIEKLLDKDHLIGHSYFMTVASLDDLKSAFQSKIIPLLQEYFFGDYGKIGLVIGKGFFEDTKDANSENVFADFDDYEASDFSERSIYKLINANNLSDEDFLVAINQLLKK
ncbi:AAA family ATPase [Epilithonimonas mollis]|uniref:AAA domain (Dynein-related subfamily) n=1 Tax=Epilithonimonas mollis TaxID=216903 RepID=A0A1M6UIR7_9FLAO|nr:AAA family ATPase [Epilithonimonas mollis]SHK69112.1 AAA domain (dynein-related subfamily) [Epilithonimonas mollis]